MQINTIKSWWLIFQEPLKVSLFYESLCPDCVQFIEDQLMDVYKLFKDHIQLELLPYGNAHVSQLKYFLSNNIIKFNLNIVKLLFIQFFILYVHSLVSVM